MGRSRMLRRLVIPALVLAGLSAVLLAGRTSAHAANSVITFDDLNVPAGGLVTVNTQYSPQGVTFNDVSALDYSQPPFPSGFAHSGTVAVEQCYSTEFCKSPVTASFTAGQRTVKVWVGTSFPLQSPLDVRLTAFDANHVSVGTADITLPVNAAVTPIQHPLEVTVTNPTIRSLEVSAPPDGFTSGIAVDDVEFSAAGPAPPCDATSVPTVQITQPGSGLVVQNNEFLLQGSVATGGAPIESAQVIDNSSAGVRKATLYPSLVKAAGGPFGAVRFNGLLSPGLNKLLFAATNCLGTGGVERDVTLSPIPPAAGFRLLGLEVTQAVQSPATTVPLIAATANSFKRTFVRVYLGVTGVSRVTGVSGRLTASRPDGSLPGGPAGVPSLNSITVDSAGTLESGRASLATSLNFELPREWLTAGQLHLQIDHLEIEGAQSGLPCDDCENPGPAGPGGPFGPALVRFHTVPPLRLWLVGVPYRSAGTVVTPRQLDFDMLVSWLHRAYPSADVQVTQANMATLASPPSSCDEVNALLSQWAAMAHDTRTRFYGLIPDNNQQNFVGGCSAIGGQYGSGPAGPVFPEEHPWDLDGSYADAYGGHEIAHMYGRKHPGECAGQDRADPDYPFPGGFLGNEIYDFQGFDTGDASLGLPVSLDDWRGNWHDVMTYCHFQWMSDYTYRGILQNLCAADQDNCPEHALFGARAVPSATAPRARSGGLAVSITGTLRLATGKLVLEPLWARAGLTLTAPVPGSAYAIEMQGAGGAVLARVPFSPQELSDAPNPAAAKALINEVVPFPVGTQRIMITHDTKTLASVPVSAHAPTVRILSPNRGGSLKTKVTVRWMSSDADGGRRWYTLLYSPDGKQFIPVATGLTRTRLRVDLTGLPGGSGARFEVIASDGVRTGSDLSDRAFRVPVKPPRVSIAAPAQQASSVAGQAITFTGTATDLQDGELQASQLVWSSSLQGVLGTGPAITVTLQPGTHVITLAATNRGGESAVATVTVTVSAVPPVVNAVIEP